MLDNYKALWESCTQQRIEDATPSTEDRKRNDKEASSGVSLKLKKYKSKICVSIIALLLIFAVPLPKSVEIDFYEFHVWECEQAHANNMSFSLCSGFWCEPKEEHIESPWVWHPSEDPKTIPHGSCTGQTKIIVVLGIYGWLTSPWYV